jgi:hypothetical protein
MMARCTRRVPLLTLAVVMLCFAGCSAHAKQTQTQTHAPTAQLAAGDAMPNFRYTLLDARVLSTTELRGHPYVLWLMATWCSSCQGGTEVMAKHIADLRARGVRVVQLEVANDLGSPGPPLRAFANGVGTAASSPNWYWGVASPSQTQALDPGAYPDIYYLVNANGTIAEINGAPAATWSEIARFAHHANARQSSVTRAHGGTIAVTMTPGEVKLASNRFTCASCARRVIPAIEALRGVTSVRYSPFVGVSDRGLAKNGLIGMLTVVFNASVSQPTLIADAAQRALQADPHNHAPVSIVYRK